MADDSPTNHHNWYPFDQGSTIGTIGSEAGQILLDEEHPAGARITLERDGHTPFGITCGIYGCFFHTAFASTESEALTKYTAMKDRLGELLLREDNIYDDLHRFVEQF
jgi:hypothetical protein